MRHTMGLEAHTAEWYDRLATLQTGYYYPWRSQLERWHGEDTYLAMVHEYLHADADVLDAACGHGDVALEIAPHCRSILGYDRTAAWIQLAEQAARERNLTNTAFVCHDSSPQANGGHARLPAEDAAFDLLICSKGPFHWIEDARRVARPGATLLMLVPDATPLTPWHAYLPASLQLTEAHDPNWARPAIEQRLAKTDLVIDSWWSFDVPEIFPDPEQLYMWRTFATTPDEVPSFAQVRPILERIFEEYGGPRGVEIRRRRYIWKAVVPD